jgi:Cdc6-like AAA superfamily ATPase
MTIIEVQKSDDMYATIAKVKNIVFQHPAYQKASEEIEKVYKLKLVGDVARNILCLGSPGTGKSTLKNQLQMKYPVTIVNDRTIQHLVCVETPSKPTIKNMAETILIELNDPLFYRGSAMQKTQRIRILVKEKEVKMIIIDELQHFIDHSGNRTAAEVSDWLKTLMEDTKISFVLMGLPRSVQLLTINSQLKRRFSQRVKLPPFTIEKVSDMKIFGSVVKQLDKLFTLPVSISITAERTKRFYYATYGVIDYVVKLMTCAYELAITKKCDHLSDDILRLAFINVIWDDCQPKYNPFDKKFIWKPLDDPDMPFHQAVEPDDYIIS